MTKLQKVRLLRAAGGRTNASYVREIEAAGYAELAPKRCLRVTDNGVKPALIRPKEECGTATKFVGKIRVEGYPDITPFLATP